MSTLDDQVKAYTKAFSHFGENHIVHVAYGQTIARRMRERGARSALSLGIGHTEVARPLIEALRRGELDHYVIVDAAGELVRAMRSELQPLPAGLDIVEAWFESFESSAAFDTIEAGFVLEHVDDPARVLLRMHDLLETNGRMHVAVPNARSLHRLVGHHCGLLDDVYRLSDADRELGHRRYFDLDSLTSLLHETGWRVERTAGMLLKPFTTSQMASLGLGPEVWAALQRVAEEYPEISNAFEVEVTAA